MIPLAELSLQNGEGKWILEQPLNRPLERTCSERRVVPFGGQHFAGGRRQLEGELSVAHQLLESAKLEIDDVFDLRLAKRSENDDVVDPIEKLRAKVLSQRAGDLGFDDSTVVAGVLQDVRAPDVGSHDDDSVPEIHGAAL